MTWLRIQLYACVCVRVMRLVWIIVCVRVCACHATRVNIYPCIELCCNVVWSSYVTHMNEFGHIWMNHVTYEWVKSHLNESCQIWMRHVMCERVVSHLWMSHVTHMNESCHTYKCHTYVWVMSHIRTSPATHMNESCHTYEWVMSHI